jgi:RimJ/RimL family protein N-acetyltransferase
VTSPAAPPRIPVPQVLEGPVVRLEPLTRDALPELFAAIGRPEVFAGGYGGGPAGHRDTVEGFVAWAEAYYPWREGLPFAIRLSSGPDDGRLVGTSSLAEFEPAKERAHLGWTAYDPAVWGTAVNPAAKRLLLGLAFDSGFGRVKIQADALNERSRAAIAKLGATFEGVTRRDGRRADGSWRDAAVFSVLLDDWPRVRDGLDARVRRALDAAARSA